MGRLSEEDAGTAFPIRQHGLNALPPAVMARAATGYSGPVRDGMPAADAEMSYSKFEGLTILSQFETLTVAHEPAPAILRFYTT